MKKCKTVVSIFSKDRNKSRYLYPNDYSIPLNKILYNVEKISVKQASIPNYFAINSQNNILKWQYPSKMSCFK